MNDINKAIFKIVAKVGNRSLFSGATAVQSRPKSHTFTVNLALFAPTAKMAVKKPWKGVYPPSECRKNEVLGEEQASETLLPE